MQPPPDSERPATANSINPPSAAATLVERVAARARVQLPVTIAELSQYVRVPAISCEPEHASDVRRLAQVVRERLHGLGFEAEVRELEGALPLVSGVRRCGNPTAPTVLIYGHLDLQPVKGEPWTTPPHEAVRKKTADGDRLFARGVADDMGGWVSHLAAVAAWLQEAGEVPVHLKFVIEGEEEIGSPNLERFMDEFPGDFVADTMVLTDCENPSTVVPGLTTSLRGLYEVNVKCEALASDVHSGLWGNMAPDVSTALVRLLARLTDEHGRPVFALQDVPEAFKKSAEQVPIDSEVVRDGANLLPFIEPLPEEGSPVPEWLWRQPALTILSTTLPRPEEQKNALRAEASATLSIRIPPGATKEDIRSELDELLLSDAPGGVRVTLEEQPGGAESWLYEPKGEAFAAANRAYEKAWGRPLVQIGIGGSIPFVALFGRRYAHLPLILNGVMDPQTGAHGPNESLHLAVFEKAICANVYLYEELSQVKF
jgi:acetylornithine deacetylase/succinyl-diaminopimelate desuccinylase-like protein